MRTRANPVLMYHDIVVDGSTSGLQGADKYKITPEVFSRHLGSMDATWTFDDGGVSAMETAAILEKAGTRGTFFVITNRLGAPGFLSVAQVKELSDRGHGVGSHSHTHPNRIDKLSPMDLREEWRQSLELLSDATGERITEASVPNGFYSWRVGRAAAEAGILVLYTSEPIFRIHSVQGCELVGRTTVTRHVGDIRRMMKPHRRFVRWVVWNAKKPLKRLLLGNT